MKVVFETEENFQLELGDRMTTKGTNTVRLRKTKDPELLRRYEAGKINVIEGEEFLEQATTDYSDIPWKSLVSDIENGEYDDQLDDIESSDDRSSIQDAIQSRRETLESDA